MIKIKPPVIKKQDPYTQVVGLIKAEKNIKAINFLLHKMSIEDAAEYCKELIVKSNLKSYRLAISRFVYAYDNYKEHNDPKILADYAKTIDVNYKDPLYELQTVVNNLCAGLVTKKHTPFLHCIYYTVTRYDHLIDDSELEEGSYPEAEVLFKQIAIDLAVKVYPQAAPLKVLYGNK